MTAQETKDSLQKMKEDILTAIREDRGRTPVQTDSTMQLRQTIKALPSRPSQNPGSSQPGSSVSNPQDQLMAVLRDAVATLSTVAADVSADKQILEWLWFEDLYSRENSIDRAHQGTYEWIFRSEDDDTDSQSGGDSGYATPIADRDLASPEPSDEDNMEAYNISSDDLLREQTERQGITRQSFNQWLEHDSGLFYISGKPGSGKSTLMKYIANNDETIKRLDTWAGESKLLHASFFFWRTGSPLQKSFKGLYRGILWEILRQCPGSAERVFPRFVLRKTGDISTATTHRPEPELHELEAAFQTIVNTPALLQHRKICLFIDALDEYEGDYWKLGKCLAQACDSANMKICVSSRHYNEFQDLFVDSGRAHTWVQIHDLTRMDMTRFATDELEGDERFGGVRSDDPRYGSLVSDIVERAEGVFLWTKLVIRQLLKSLGNSCSVAQLRECLNTLPNGLDALFRDMLGRVDPTERRRFARTVRVLLADSDSPLYYHSVIDDLADDPLLADRLLNDPPGPFLTPEDWAPIRNNMQKRLLARGQGLLHMQETTTIATHFLGRCQVGFTHRSVQDFLKSPDISHELISLTDDFSPWKALALANLSLVKHLPRIEDTNGRFKVHEADSFRSILILDGKRAQNDSDGSDLVAEVQAVCRLAEQRALLTSSNNNDEEGGVYLGQRRAYPKGYLTRIKAVSVDDAKVHIACTAISTASSQLVSRMVEADRGLLISGSMKLLHAASYRDMSLQHSWDSSHTKRLAAFKPNPNRLSAYPDLDYRQKGSEDGFFTTQAQWSAWTSFLHLIHWLIFEHEYSISDARKKDMADYLDAYIALGADMSVCFVGCPVSNTDLSRGSPCYLELPVMLQIWGIPISYSVQTKERQRRTPSGWLNWFTSPRGTPASPIQRCSNPQDLDMSCFWVAAVVPFENLGDISVTDMHGAWETLSARHRGHAKTYGLEGQPFKPTTWVQDRSLSAWE